MKFNLLLSIVISVLCLFSCNDQPSIESSEEQTWKLGWRMTYNSMIKNYALAELQFDSLRRQGDKIDAKFLKTGLEIKSELGKHSEVIELLMSQSPETLTDICTSKSLTNAAPCLAYIKEEEEVENEPLQLDLIKMYINDQYARGSLLTDMLEKYKLTKKEVIIDSFGMNTDKRNRDLLDDIIHEYGFPSKQLVGKEAMQGIFLIIQHADNDTAWQKSQFSNIERAVKKGDMDGQSYAYLYDRIKVNSGEKQLYGSQFTNVDVDENLAELAETEDLENLDKRRREFGMMPIETYKKVMLFYAPKK